MLSFFKNLNFMMFELIYSCGKSHEIFLQIALFSSRYLTTILAVLLLGFAIYQSKYRILFIKALVLTLITSLISTTLDHTVYFPRPFTLGLSENLIHHSDNNSFPSSHMIVISTIAFAYLFSSQKWIGYVLFFAALMVGWSRIYLGVHFPYDVLGSLVIAFIVNYLAYLQLKKFPKFAV